MQNNKYVYFLSVKQAIEIAKKHEDEDDWDIFTDPEAIAKGMNNIMENAVDTINLNRFNANLPLFRELVTEIAVNVNELILIASTVTNDKEINHGIY